MSAGAVPDRGLGRRLVWVARDIKLSHSLFALPFALLALFLAGAWRGRGPSVGELALIVLCMVLARTSAMAFNRWADAELDADNPRTRQRAIPSGRLTRAFMLGVVAVSALGFVAATAGFGWLAGNWWPLILSPAALGWVLGYSYTKHFTWLCHLVLGAALALSPLGASLAVAPGFLGQVEPYWLAAMVLFWVSGFDVIYSLSDVEADRARGLYSLPARLGAEGALVASAVLHAAAMGCLAALATVTAELGPLFRPAIAVVAVLLIMQHVWVWRSRPRRLAAGFATFNGAVSLVLAAAGIADVVR